MNSMKSFLYCATLFGGVSILTVNAFAAQVSGKVTLLEKTKDGSQPVEKIEYVFVSLVPDDETSRAVVSDESKFPKVTVYMNQVNKEFDPRIVAVQKGAKVRFGNADPWFHNVYGKEPEFSLGRYPRGFYKEQLYEKTGVYHVFCDIHLNMHAQVLVVDTPLFAQVKDDGAFVVKDVPPGKYKLTAWHERAGTVTLDLSVANENITDQQLTLEEKERRPIERGKETNPYAGARNLLR